MPRTLALILASLALFLAPRAARACSCVAGLDFVAPADGASSVPTNARIWIGLANLELDELALVDARGAEVALRREDLGGGQLAVLTPEQALLPGSTYVATARGEALTAFVTGAGPSSAAPEVPRVLSRDARSDGFVQGTASSCGPTHAVWLTLTEPGLVRVLTRAGDPPASPEPTGAYDALGVGAILGLGQSGCMSSWDEAGPGASTTVRLGAFDLTGRFSGWSAPERVAIPFTGCGCAATSGGAPLAVLALLLALGLRARREGRTPSSPR